MKFGLIGHPIARSLSPGLFKSAYDGKYPYDLIQGEDFEESYQRFLDGYDGINVTAPFKELAFAKADIISEECRLAKATNLLVKTPEGVKAYNSDLLGVRLWLQEITSVASSDAVPLASADPASGAAASKRTPPTSWAPPPAARGVARFSPAAASDAEPKRITVLICGCGGAGKAAAVAAATLGMKCILMNRDIARAEELAENLNSNIGKDYSDRTIAEVQPLSGFCGCFREADIIIYNIPSAIPEINMLKDTDFNCGTPKHILEANYKDPSFDEEFQKKMRNANPQATYTGGKIWLLYQALTGYEIFTGEKPDLERMSALL